MQRSLVAWVFIAMVLQMEAAPHHSNLNHNHNHNHQSLESSSPTQVAVFSSSQQQEWDLFLSRDLMLEHAQSTMLISQARALEERCFTDSCRTRGGVFWGVVLTGSFIAVCVAFPVVGWITLGIVATGVAIPLIKATGDEVSDILHARASASAQKMKKVFSAADAATINTDFGLLMTDFISPDMTQEAFVAMAREYVAEVGHEKAADTRYIKETYASACNSIYPGIMKRTSRGNCIKRVQLLDGEIRKAAKELAESAGVEVAAAGVPGDDHGAAAVAQPGGAKKRTRLADLKPLPPLLRPRFEDFRIAPAAAGEKTKNVIAQVKLVTAGGGGELVVVQGLTAGWMFQQAFERIVEAYQADIPDLEVYGPGDSPVSVILKSAARDKALFVDFSSCVFTMDTSGGSLQVAVDASTLPSPVEVQLAA